jgi:hypothetical protein
MGMTGFTDEELAKAAYQAYGDSAAWRNYADKPMPTWDELPTVIKVHWQAAVKRVVEVIA